MSVSRIENKTHEEIVKEGKRVVREHKTAKTLYGWAKISTQEVKDVGLVVLDDDVPPGHSSIVGWPDDEAEWPRYLQELAELATDTQLAPPIPVP